MIIVECYRDQALVYRLGFVPQQVRHAHSKSKVIGTVDCIQRGIGIIDEDPDAGRPRHLREYTKRTTVGRITLLVKEDDDGKRIIQVSPRLEDWLYTIAKRNKISPGEFGLPDDPRKLHSSSLRRDEGSFGRFLIALVKVKDEEIIRFTEWIKESGVLEEDRA